MRASKCEDIRRKTIREFLTVAFPKVATLSYDGGGHVNAAMTKDSLERARFRRQTDAPWGNADRSTHFLSHATEAFAVLGLNWNEENKI